MATPDEIKRRKTPAGAAATALGAPPAAGVVPAGPATVSPVAASINEQMRVERARVSPLAKEINAVVGAPKPPAPVPLPAYRTADGFQQTPAPANPNPRAALGAAPAPAIPAPSGAAARAPGATGRPLTGIKPSKAGAAGLAVEGLNIAGAAQRGGVAGAAGEAVAAGTRLGAAKLGAELGSKLPVPAAWRGATTVLGGVAGYAGGQQLVESAGNLAPQGFKDAQASVEQMTQEYQSKPISWFLDPIGRATQILRGNPNGDPVPAAPASSTPMTAASPPRNNAVRTLAAATPASAAPAAAAPQQQGVIGTYQAQGRPQRQVFEDGTVSPTTAPVNGAFSTIPAYQGTAATAAAKLGAPSVSGPDQFADSERRRFQEQVDSQIKGLGDLNMRSKRELVGQLLGLKGRSVGQAFDASAGKGIEEARLGQSAAQAQLGADVQREEIAAGERSSRRSARKTTQTITGADGTMYSLDGTVAAPITTADGKNVAAATKPAGNEQAKIAAALLETLIPAGATPDEITAAARQANTAAAALMSGSGAQSGSKPSTEADFLKAARAANPGVSDADLKAYYQQNYGR